MANRELLDRLNDAIAREIQVSIQYVWQHVMVKGINTESLGDIFRKTSIAEMKHAEKIAERLYYLGGVPTQQPTPIEVGKTAREMLQLDKKAEEEALVLYRKIITLAEKEGDVVTASLFTDILEEEEDHHHNFSRLLEE